MKKIVLVALFFSLSIQGFSKDYSDVKIGERKDHQLFSLARLLTYDERLHEKDVGFSGYVSFDNLTAGIMYLSKSDYEYNNVANSIAVYFDNESLKLSHQVLEELEGTLIIVEGKYLVPQPDKKRNLPPPFGDLLRVENITSIYQLNWEKNTPRSELMRRLKTEKEKSHNKAVERNF